MSSSGRGFVPELVADCLSRCAVGTIRRRKLPMESMLWTVIGMALFRQFPMRHLLINRAFDGVSTHQMQRAESLIDTTPESSLTLLDKGFY